MTIYSSQLCTQNLEFYNKIIGNMTIIIRCLCSQNFIGFYTEITQKLQDEMTMGRSSFQLFRREHPIEDTEHYVRTALDLKNTVLLNFLVTVKAASHECV